MAHVTVLAETVKPNNISFSDVFFVRVASLLLPV